MKVCFVQFSGMQESLGIASLAACLEAGGHEADLVLLSHCDDLYKYLSQAQPDLVGFSAVTGGHKEIMELARLVKSRTEYKTIIGGPHATYYAEEIAAEKGFDYICRGEGERALVELLDRLQAGEDVRRIDNLWVRTADGWIRNDLGPLVENLDSLPMPRRDIYFKYAFLRDMPLKRFITGIGCPFPCTFCHSINLKREYRGKGRFVRRKSVDRVIAEILDVQSRAVLKRLHFSDDTFTLNKGWMEEFAEKYPEQVGIPFSCNARLDTKPETVALLAKAGCRGVQLGFESGSERLRRDWLKKRWTNEQAMVIVKEFKRHRITTIATNMIGLPTETMEEVLETVLWNAKVGFKYTRCNVYMPFPKLDLTKMAQDEGLISKSFSLKDYDPSPLNPVFNLKHVNELINLANLFYPAVKFRLLRGLIVGTLIKMKPNRLFYFLGSLNLLQEFFFFGLRPVSAWKYFRNTLGSIRGFKYGAWPATRVAEAGGIADQTTSEGGDGCPPDGEHP